MFVKARHIKENVQYTIVHYLICFMLSLVPTKETFKECKKGGILITPGLPVIKNTLIMHTISR